MKLLIAGDQGVRPARTREDQLWEDALEYDQFFRMYGWGPREVDECPKWLLDRLPGIQAARQELAARKAKLEQARKW